MATGVLQTRTPTATAALASRWPRSLNRSTLLRKRDRTVAHRLYRDHAYRGLCDAFHQVVDGAPNRRTVWRAIYKQNTVWTSRSVQRQQRMQRVLLRG